jgi:hypothetical protein
MMTGSKKVFLVKKTIDLDPSPGRRDVTGSESRQSIKPVKQSSTLYETLLASHGLTSKSRKTAIKLQDVKANVDPPMKKTKITNYQTAKPGQRVKKHSL